MADSNVDFQHANINNENLDKNSDLATYITKQKII